MALLLNLLYKANVLYSKQSLHTRILTFICVLGGFTALVSLCQATPVVAGVVDAGSTLDISAVETVSHAAAVPTDTPAASTRGPLCSELPCRMRNPDYVRRYVHDLSLAREREYDFQVQYVRQQELPHKREVFLKVER